MEWWRDRNNEWCFDWLDEANGRFCDQRYLDYFPKNFTGVHVLRHRGANLAPWNVGASIISKRDSGLYADDDVVLFFHFHGLKRLARRQFLTIQRNYGAPLSRIVRQHLYEPYLKELLTIEDEIETRFGAMDRSSVRELFGTNASRWNRFKTAIKIRRAIWQGYSVTVPK
jgi:hypothetical protein